jgi:hypothetical protein
MDEDSKLQEIINNSLKENEGKINPNLLNIIAKNSYNIGLEDASDTVLIDNDRQSILKLKK